MALRLMGYDRSSKPGPHYVPGRVMRFKTCLEPVVDIDKAQIAAVFTDEIERWLFLWLRWKRFGWPDSGGWAQQSQEYVALVEICEAEVNSRGN